MNKDKIKLSDLADIQIVEAPKLSRLETFDTRLLSVDRNTPLARALNARMMEDSFLRDFGRPSADDTLNERDNSTRTRDYLN